MDIVISILIASVVSLGIAIFFHENDKKKNAMDRVKRYADSRIEDMDKSYKVLENHFNMLIAEFDSRQSQANAAVKLLTQQNQDFSEKITNLDRDIKAVQTIEAQINKYSAQLGELDEMTAQVEENLLRIQKESVIVNKLNDRLDKQQQTVDGIDKKIPQISEHFSQENAEQLKAIGTTLLDEYKNYAEKIASDIRKSQSDAENALAKIKQQIQEAYNQAAAKAESLENTAFDHLSQQATERSEKYISELKTQNAELDAKITKSFKDSEAKLVADIKSDLTKMNENFKQSIDNLSSNYENKVQSLNESFTKNADTLSANFTNKVQTLHDKYNEQLDSIAGKNEGIITKLETKFNEDFTRINQKCTDDCEKISTRYEENYEAITKKYDDDYQNFSAKYDEAVDKIAHKYDTQLGSIGAKGDKELTAIEEKINADIQKLRNDYTKTFESATAFNNKKINEFNENFIAEHQKLQNEYDQAINDMTDASTGKLEGLKENLDQKINAITGDCNSRIADLETGINQTISEISDTSTGKINNLEERINEEINSFADEFKDQLNGLQNDYNSSLSNFKNDIGSRLSAVENEYEAKTATLEANIRDVTERYETEEQGLQNVFSERLRALDEDYKQQIAEIRLSLEESIKKCTETSEFLKRDVDGNSKSLETIQTELDEEIRIMQEKYAGLYNDAIASADQKEREALDNFNEGASKKIDEYAQLIQQKIDQLEASITEKIRNVSLQSSNSIHEAETAVADLQKECSAANQRAQEMQPELDGKIKAITKEIEDFKTDTEIKLNNMNKYISDSVKRSVAESEQTHLNILEGIDDQLSSYKKDIEHKLSQIQNSGSDIDTLEKSLRAAMQEVQSRVLGDFDSFTSDQQRRHEEFSTQIKQDSETIETRLHEIDKSLDDLKATATGSMSAKLEDFEKAFNNNILTKNNEIDAALSDWKITLDTKLASISSNYETSRNEIEQKYQNELKANLASIVSRTTEQYDKLADAVEKSKLGLESNISEIQETLGDFQEETRSKLSQISVNTDSELKKELENTMNKVESSINKVQSDILSNYAVFEQSMQEKQETGNSSIDAALSEFNAWKQQLRSQLDGANDVFKNELESFMTNTKAQLEETHQKLGQDMKNYAAYIQDQQNELSDKITSLQNQTENSVKEYEERSEEIIKQLNETYTKMLADTEERVREQNSDSAQSLAQLKKDIQTASDQNRANQAQFVLKMQNDANEMQVRMGDLTKELQSIRANIQQFERADAMQNTLKANLAELDDKFERLDSFADTAEDLTNQYNSIIKLNEDMEKQISSIEQQKQRVTLFEQKFGQLFALSNRIDERIQSLNITSDDIGSMEVAVRDYKDKLDIVSQQYERLDKKEELVNRVLKDVDTSFANLKNMEQRIADCERQVTSLPNEIKSVQANVDRLLQSGPKITEAASKLQNLDSVLTETEKRMDTLQATNTGLKKTQLDQQVLQREINNKFDALHSITKNEVAKNKGPQDKSMPPSERETIRALKREGWTIQEIASRFKRTTTEIELLLELPE